jgi:methionyl-tRNA synthetase
MVIESENETQEFVYTILTRTVSLLIIVLFPNIPKSHLDILRTFNFQERAIFWDEETESMHHNLLSHGTIDQEIEDVDDSDAFGPKKDNQSSDDLNDEIESLI